LWREFGIGLCMSYIRRSTTNHTEWFNQASTRGNTGKQSSKTLHKTFTLRKKPTGTIIRNQPCVVCLNLKCECAISALPLRHQGARADWLQANEGVCQATSAADVDEVRWLTRVRIEQQAGLLPLVEVQR
jgi:hypothetical protein